MTQSATGLCWLHSYDPTREDNLLRDARQSLYGVTTADLKADLSADQLAGIGAVTIIWNEIEFMLDCALYSGEKLPHTCLIGDLPKRRLDEKIKHVARAALRWNLPTDFIDSISCTAAKFDELKALRNAVIHARLHNRELGIGRFIARRGTGLDVLLTPSALEWLYDQLAILQREIRALIAIFDLVRTTEIAEQSGLIAPGQVDPIPEARTWLSRMDECAEERAQLGVAPTFPANH